MEITFSGEYGLPILLSGILAVTYKVLGDVVGNRFKIVFSILAGIGLGLLGLWYGGLEWNVRNVVDYVLYGFMTGTSASGTYEFYRGVSKPRE